MRPSLRFPWLLAVALLPAGCRHAVIPLHEKLGFAGKVTIQVEDGADARRVEGELVFDRASRNLQWIVRGAPGPTVSLVRKENDAVEAFENGVPRLITAGETLDFTLVKSV